MRSLGVSVNIAVAVWMTPQIMDMPLDYMDLDECVYFSMGTSNMGFVVGVPLAEKLLVRPSSSTRAWAGF